MRITLEFNSIEEHDLYIHSKSFERNVVQNQDCEPIHLVESAIKGIRIEDTTRRRFFSAYELDFIRTYYQTKKLKWIAAALRRKVPAISQQLTKMYNAGLPKKKNRNGDIKE
jgi:hypothetical protein